MEYQKIPARKLKTMIGETMYAVPTGNAAPRGMVDLKDYISGGQIVRVGSVRVELAGVGAFHIDGSCDNYGCGYLLFETKGQAEDYIDLVDFEKKLRYGGMGDLSVEQLRAIKEVVEG